MASVFFSTLILPDGRRAYNLLDFLVDLIRVFLTAFAGLKRCQIASDSSHRFSPFIIFWEISFNGTRPIVNGARSGSFGSDNLFYPHICVAQTSGPAPLTASNRPNIPRLSEPTMTLGHLRPAWPGSVRGPSWGREVAHPDRLEFNI